MKATSRITAAVLLTFLLAGCGENTKTPGQQVTPSSTASAPSQGNSPQDFVAVSKEPTVIKKVEPVYPELAKKAGLEGKVWVKIWVDTEGRAKEVKILKSDSEVFNQPTIDAAKQFVFTPAYVDNKPVDVWVSVPFKYALADKQVLKPETSTGPASPTEASFMKGYIAAKEEGLSTLQKEEAAAKASGKPDAALQQRIQKVKAELQVLKDAMRAMEGTK